MKKDVITEILNQEHNNEDSLQDFLNKISSLPENSKKAEINKIAKEFVVPASFANFVHNYFCCNTVAMSIPEPSKKSYSATKLAKGIDKALSKFVHCQEYERKALVLWILNSWFVEYVKYVPYLIIDSAEPECGKSQTMAFLEQTCRKAAFVPSLTTAVITRIMTTDTPPTLLIDECDVAKKTLDQARDFINAGYQRSGMALKADLNDQRKLIKLEPFGNKAFAGIDICHTFPGTVISRCIVIHLKRYLSHDDECYVNDVTLTTENENWGKLRQYLRRMELNYSDKFEEIYNDPSSNLAYPQGVLSKRVKQIWRGIFVLAHIEKKQEGDSMLLKWAQEALKKLAPRDVDMLSEKERFKKNLQEVLADFKGDFISSAEIQNKLNANPEWGYCDMRGGKGISIRQFSLWLKSYNQYSHREFCDDVKQSGYFVKNLKKIFS